MSFLATLPAPKQAAFSQPAEQPAPTSTAVAVIGSKEPPPYLRRQKFIPRRPEDFCDGGAFPEIQMAQYPLGKCSWRLFCPGCGFGCHDLHPAKVLIPRSSIYLVSHFPYMRQPSEVGCGCMALVAIHCRLPATLPTALLVLVSNPSADRRFVHRPTSCSCCVACRSLRTLLAATGQRSYCPHLRCFLHCLFITHVLQGSAL